MVNTATIDYQKIPEAGASLSCSLIWISTVGAFDILEKFVPSRDDRVAWFARQARPSLRLSQPNGTGLRFKLCEMPAKLRARVELPKARYFRPPE
jgi:hypothetical protein